MAKPNNALIRARLVAKMNKGSSLFKTKETAEPQSRDKNDPRSRFDATTSGKEVYRKDTPGQ